MLIPFDTLFKKYNIKAQGVLHLGANTGQEAEAYHRNGAERVIWIEALPDVYLQLLKNIAKYPKNVAFCLCVSDKDGEILPFNIASNEGQSSSLLEFGTHSKDHPTVKYEGQIEVKTIRVDSFLHDSIFDLAKGWFLNVDLQGAELMALHGMGELLRHFDYAYIEVNRGDVYKGCPQVGDIDAYLAKFGLVGMEEKWIGPANWGDKFYMRS